MVIIPLRNSQLSLSATKTIGTDFYNSIALDLPRRSVTLHPRLSANILSGPMVADNRVDCIQPSFQWGGERVGREIPLERPVRTTSEAYG